MQKRILFIMHQATSDPGRIGEAALAYGFEPVICRHSCGDPLPQSIDDYAAVILFGGPMSANDDHLPAIRAELDWLEMPLREKKPFLGICLGAQMLARVLGGNVMHHERGLHEIGFYKVRARPDGKNLFDDEQYFYQWHSEGISLPLGNREIKRLAASEIFDIQAFSVGNAYGIQFHPDVTEEMMKNWCRIVAHRMVLPGAQAYDRQLEGQVAHGHDTDIWIERFFQYWLLPTEC